MATITLDEAKERIRRLAEERPDYVYELLPSDRHDGPGLCVYFDPEGKPSCIVGHAFAEELRAAGVDFDTRLSVESREIQQALALDPAARDFLAYVQSMQDQGVPWGDAYQDALGLLAEE